ncbi:MAG: DUF342 domain-containing protein, partial [Clostridia bacterium]
IDQICDDPERFANQPQPIADGMPPVPGTDGRIEFTFHSSEKDELRPKEMEDGRVDYYNLVNIPNVSRGQLLAKKVPPTPGIDGTDITGAIVPAKLGKEAVIKPGKNVVLNEDKTLLYAAIDGQVSFSDDLKINVFPVFEVNGDVDFGVGNIDFVGTVVVRGSVPTGFRIKAAGDIRILGSVEGAELEAGGSIEIRSGIVAQDKGSVIAGNTIKTSFIQNGNVSATGDVIVSQSIMFSHVRAGKSIVCKGPKGIIIGGTLQAGEKIVARVFGNTSATPTVLEVGAKPELRNELTQIQRELQVMYENMRKADQGLNVLNQIVHSTGTLPPDKRALQIKLTNTRLMMEKDIKRMDSRRQEVEKMIEGDSPAAVEILSIMYPGIKLVFGRLVRFIKQEFSRTRFIVIEGEITTSTLI